MDEANIVYILAKAIDTQSVGDIVDAVMGMQASEILPMILSSLRPIPGGPAGLDRRLLFLGALLNRYLFEVRGIPKDRDFIV